MQKKSETFVNLIDRWYNKNVYWRYDKSILVEEIR